MPKQKEQAMEYGNIVELKTDEGELIASIANTDRAQAEARYMRAAANFCANAGLTLPELETLSISVLMRKAGYAGS
jgi:hypothetical protein